MAWSGLRVRRRALLTLSVLLACGTVLGPSRPAAAVPSADEPARRWLDTVSSNIAQPGRVFRTQLDIRERGEAGEVTSRGEIWIDTEQRKARLEVRRDNNLIGVTVIDNWQVAAFDAINNRVNTITVPEDARANVRNPAFSVLAPSLLAAFQAGQINAEADVTTTTEPLAGRETAKLTLTIRVTQEVPAAPSSGQQGSGQGQPQTQTVRISQDYTLWIDTATGLPVQESVRTAEDGGREVGTRTVTLENPTLVERATVAADVLSVAAVERMLATLEQMADRARRIGFPLYWLGMELPRAFTDAKGQRQPALVLNDVQVVDVGDAPRQVVLAYGTRDEPGVPYVLLRHMVRSQFEQMQRDAGLPALSQIPGVEQRPVQIPAGGQGVMFQLQPPSQAASGSAAGGAPRGASTGSSAAGGSASRPANLPPLIIVQVTAGDALMLIEAPPLFLQDGRQGNPFLDATQIAALAGALGRMN